MAGHSFNVYIDESGDEGFDFSKAPSEWFVLGSVIVPVADDLKLVDVLRDVRQTLGREPKKPLHFRDLRHEQRLAYVDKITKAPVRTAAVLLHKPTLASSHLKDKGKLYFYGCRLLVERISWYCRDTFRDGGLGGDGKGKIVFSNRNALSVRDFENYLGKLFSGTAFVDHSEVAIHWNALSTPFETYSHGKRAGLQLADAVAGSFFRAVQPHLGFTEPRYAEMLKPVVYERRGNYLSYGVKVYPADYLKEEKLRRLREYFATKT